MFVISAELIRSAVTTLDSGMTPLNAVAGSAWVVGRQQMT
jgi:hypothetical protein